MTVANDGGRTAALKKWSIRIVIGLSLVWTATMYIRTPPTLDQAWQILNQAKPFAVAVFFTEACFMVGLGMIAVGMGLVAWRANRVRTMRYVLAGLAFFAGLTVFAMISPWHYTLLVCFTVMMVGWLLGWSRFGKASWLADFWRMRSKYRAWLYSTGMNPLVRFGFHLNWFGAMGTGLIGLIAVPMVLPVSMWGVMYPLAIDLLATFAWRIPIQRRLGHEGYLIRRATEADIPGIVALDTSRYEEITPVYAPDPHAMFRQRLVNAPDLFWVMVDAGGTIVGLISLAPTDRGPDDFVSWEESTANGTLNGKVVRGGRYTYVPALTTTHEVGQSGDSDRLIAYAIGACMREYVYTAYFAARMPGYYLWQDYLTPQQYFDAMRTVNGRQVRFDNQLAMYEGLGMNLRDPLQHGFDADWKSGQCGVPAVYNIPVMTDDLHFVLRIGIKRFKVPVPVNLTPFRRQVAWIGGCALQYAANHPRLWVRVKDLI